MTNIMKENMAELDENLPNFLKDVVYLQHFYQEYYKN